MSAISRLGQALLETARSRRSRARLSGAGLPRAFTLIELLIVVAIISILAAIAIPNLLDAQVRSKVASAKNALRVLEVGIEAYHVDHRAYPYTQSYAFNLWVPPGGHPQLTKDVYCGGLTTPVQYIATIPDDPFKKHRMTLKDIDLQPLNGPAPECKIDEKEAHLYVEASKCPPVIDDVYVNYERPGWGFVDDFMSQNVGVIDVSLPCDPCCNGGCPWNHRMYVWEYPPSGEAGETFNCGAPHSPFTLFSIGPDGQYAAPDKTGKPLRSRYEINNRYDPTNGTVSFGNIVRFPGGRTFPE